MKIPKTIHYCWFGGNQLPELAIKCIESWKKHLPDYEIIKWDENNYDVTKCKYIYEAYKNKKWAFVTDYARLDIVYNYGGIYFDTDVEVLKSFDDLLDNDLFLGFEDKEHIATGLCIGAVEKNEFLKMNMEEYHKLNFYKNNGELNLIPCPVITSNLLKKIGLKMNNTFQKKGYITLYPTEYFCPMDYYTGKINITSNTYSIHHYAASWLSDRDLKWSTITKRISKVTGTKFANFLIKIIRFPFNIIYRIKTKGIKNTLKYYMSKICK